jgi:hypothetical protein
VSSLSRVGGLITSRRGSIYRRPTATHELVIALPRREGFIERLL